MEDNLAIILNDSNKTNSKLQLLSAFFEEEIIYKIYLRSQVVHKLFETNPELDINKLELFHLQYTASAIELLKKIKASNERNVSLIYDEMQLNKEMMEKLNSSVFSEKNYDLDKQKQSLKINLSLRRLYQTLSDNTDEYPFSKNINTFSSRFSQDFYYDISADQMMNLIQYETADVYRNSYAIIQKKLMGLLCKHEFRTEFFCGLKTGGMIAEVYRFLDVDRHYLFFPSKSLFLLCDLSEIPDIDWTNSLSKKARIIQEMTDKNDQLESRANILKTAIPDTVRTLLQEYYDKISEVDFLQKIGNYDVQTNILRTMLNTDTF
ncbi:hypothetical protein SAMN04488128_10492 [Chitinophaga eiseniae]|uniref:Uncharacterized protein n=1 Tax=Chitinophaga eiseniae TaxID=634771 RepID=A0A1T4T7A1_9BACT|nr:hypothetical protein [Chitinophaga eiseniae]SKA36364.1 hypothetical protein SAMN04488128_10492 [Chitinophaga eiseniae]